MPSELQRVAQDLVACLDQMPRVVDALHARARRCREAAAYLAGFGSTNPAAQMAAFQLDAAAKACEEAAHYAARAPQRARAWAVEMVGGGPASGSLNPRQGTNRQPAIGSGPTSGLAIGSGDGGSGGSAGDSGGGGSGSPPGTSPPVNASPDEPDPKAQALIRRKLPVRDGGRAKTHGVWIDDEGRENGLVSGHDRYREQAERLRQELGIDPMTATSHVELKFAMFMRERGLRDETIYINNDPCSGPWSCSEWLESFLPPGARLLVHWPNAAPKPFVGKGAQ